MRGVCETSLEYDYGLLERLEPVLGGASSVCRELSSLLTPAKRLYVRVNTLKVSVSVYLDMLKERGLHFWRDPDVPEAIWHPVEGPLDVPVFPIKVVADKRAAESVMMGSDLYAPGIVYAPKALKPGVEVTIVSENGVVVGSGIAVIGYEDARKARHGLAVRVTHPRFKAPRVRDLPGFEEGLIYGQSLPSMVAVRLLNPEPGDVIVDLTAAPGGKVSHAAQLAGPGSRVVAVDRASKVAKLNENLRRLGLEWVEVVSGDSRRLPGPLSSLVGRVDKVIVDPPCSNLGVRPKVYDRRGLNDVIAAARYQRGFIEAAARLAKRGGRVLYSVCTLTWEEAEANVEYAESLGLKPIDPPAWARRRASPAYGGIRFKPAEHGTPGFYIAVLEKRG